jgi:hypothetical protein
MCHSSYLKSYGRRIGEVRKLILLIVETKISAAILPKTEELKQLAGLILLMVGTNLFLRLCAHPSYGRRTGSFTGLIILMEGTNLSAGYGLILLMAGGLPPAANSSFSW